MKETSEKMLRRSFIVAMFFLSCTVALLYNVQAAQAWNFHPFDVTVTMEKCELIDLKQQKYITEVAEPTFLKWKIEEIPSLLVPLLIPPDPGLLEKGTLKLCLYDTGCQQVSINISDSENSTMDTVILKLTIISNLEVVRFPEVFQPYAGSLNPFLKPDEEVDLTLRQYVKDNEYAADKITWEVSSDRKVWGTSITTPVFDITIDNIGGVAKIRGKQTGNGYAIFRATNPCGLQDKAELLIIVDTSPVINGKFPDIIEFGVDRTYPLNLNECVSDDQTRTDQIKWRINDVDFDWSKPPVIYEDSCVKVVIDINRIAVFSWQDSNCSGHELKFTAIDDPIPNSDDDKPGASSLPKTVELRIPITNSRLVFEEDGKGEKVLPPSVNGKPISDWEVADYNKNHLDKVTIGVTIEGNPKVIVIPQKDWYGTTDISLTAYYNGGDKSDMLHVEVTPVNDPPVIVENTIWDELRKDFGVAEVILSGDNPSYRLRLDDKAEDVDTPISEITWIAEVEEDLKGHIGAEISDDQRFATFELKDLDWSEGSITLIAFDNNPNPGEDKITISVSVGTPCPPIGTLGSLIFEEDGKGEKILPPSVNGKPISDWKVVDYNKNHLDKVTIEGNSKVIVIPQKDWYGTTDISLTAYYCDRNELVTLPVEVTSVKDPPVIEVAVQEISVSVNNPGELELKVTDVDIPISQITWQTTGNNNTDVLIDLISHRDNLATFKATFTVKKVNWCGPEDVTLIASDNDPNNPQKGDVTIRVRVIGSPVITLPEWILLQPGMPSCLDLTQYAVACDSTVEWNFTDSDNVEYKKINNLLCLQMKQGQAISPGVVEHLGYDATNADTLTTVGSIAVIILPNQLEFEEDGRGILDLPTHTNGKKIDWNAVAPNNDLNIDIQIDKAIVISTTKDRNGKTIMSLTATVSGKQEKADIDVTIISVNDSPVINETAILNNLKSVSINNPYELDLFDKVTDVETPIPQITWKTEGNKNIDVIISSDHRSVKFGVKAGGLCEIEHVKLIASDNDPVEPKTDDVTIPVRVIGSPVITIPEWILWQPTSEPFDLKQFVTACDTTVSWVFVNGQNVHPPQGNINLLSFTTTPNWSGVEKIYYTASNADNQSTEGNLSVLVIRDQLTFDEDKEGVVDLPRFIGDKPIDWAPEPNNDLNFQKETGKVVVTSTTKDWNGNAKMSLIATVNGRQERADIDVTITPVNDPPVIEVAVQEISVSVNNPGELELKVTDVDTPISQITWQTTGNNNTDVLIDLISHRDNLATFKATFTAKKVNWCGPEDVTLIASDNDPNNPQEGDVTIPVRVIASPVITLPEWILLQPRKRICLDLTQYAVACDSTVEWNFTDSDNVEHQRINNLLCLQIKQGQSISSGVVEQIGYDATNADTLTTVGSIAVIIPPDQPLEFEEDGEGVLTLPTHTNGHKIDWDAVSPNNDLNFQKETGKVVVTSTTKDWNGNTTMSLTATVNGDSEKVDIDVTIIPVNDPPVINNTAIWDQLRGDFGKDEVVISVNKPYELYLFDKVTDVDTPIPQITWKAEVPADEEQDEPIDLIIRDDHRFVTFRVKDGDWCDIANVRLTASDNLNESNPINLRVQPICAPSIPQWMLWNEKLYLPSTVPIEQSVQKWEFRKGSYIEPASETPADTVEFKDVPDLWHKEEIRYTVTYDNGISTSEVLHVIALGDLVSKEDKPIVMPLFDSVGGVQLTWNVVTDSPHVIVTQDLNKKTITFTPEANWNGQAEISITLTSENRSAPPVSITVDFTRVYDPVIVKKDLFPNPVLFHKDGCYPPISLSDKVDNPDEIPLTWGYKIIAPGNNPHIEVDIVENELVSFCSEDWVGEELVVLTVGVDTSNQEIKDLFDNGVIKIENKTVSLTVKVLGEEGKVVIVNPPIFKLWSLSSDPWNLSQYIDPPEYKNLIQWIFTPTNNIVPEHIDNRHVQFIFRSSDWTGEESIKYIAKNINTGLIEREGFITIIGIANSVVDNTSLTMPKGFNWNNQPFDLTWEVLRAGGCTMITQPANNEFTFTLDPNNPACTEGNADLKATAGPHKDTVNITVSAETPMLIIKPFRFSMEKGFSVENGDVVSLEMSENSRVLVYLADKIGNSGKDIIAPSLEIPKVIWAAKRSQYIDVQIDNMKQTATFIPDVNWDSSITDEPEVIILTAMNEKTGNSDTIEIKVTVMPTSKPVVIDKTALLCNFPNPFNAETWIPYKLSTDSDVKISIYNQTGQLVRTIDLGNREVGSYVTKDKAAYWDGRDNTGENVASGVYFYTLQARRFSETRKMMIVK